MNAVRKYTQEELNKILWSAADSSRSALAAEDYMKYVLPMLFLKYLSDLSKKRHEEYKKRFGSDEKRIEEKMKIDRFYLPPKASFDYIYSIIEQDNIGEEISKVLHKIEDANKENLREFLARILILNQFLGTLIRKIKCFATSFMIFTKLIFQMSAKI